MENSQCSRVKLESRVFQCYNKNHDGVAESPNPRDLPLRFQQVISSPAARERVFANESIIAHPVVLYA